ncbi:hypothetical protein [Streptomyces sp. MNP-20]|uniref:hypothetical protein n=1 Tax=Streptomyces sp. MNP-20 TaxID=2721165 RepID=UPI0015581BF8|nr:hypothetical protein [Streptomyces sp. MNP-20]
MTARLTWTLTLAPEPAEGAATVSTPQDAQQALVDALRAHLAGVADEGARRELTADHMPALSRWPSDMWRTIQRGRGATYNAPGAILVRLVPAP